MLLIFQKCSFSSKKNPTDQTLAIQNTNLPGGTRNYSFYLTNGRQRYNPRVTQFLNSAWVHETNKQQDKHTATSSPRRGTGHGVLHVREHPVGLQGISLISLAPLVSSSSNSTHSNTTHLETPLTGLVRFNNSLHIGSTCLNISEHIKI